MSGERFNYYLKMILNARLEEYSMIYEQIGNDTELTESEETELERLIGRYMSVYNRFGVRVVNIHTGREEEPPATVIDDFGGTSKFVEKEVKYGIEWKVYAPPTNGYSSPVNRWYYNERISKILNDLLHDVVPGRNPPSYFDIPPWIMGTPHAPDVTYVPLHEIISTAIAKGVVPTGSSWSRGGAYPGSSWRFLGRRTWARCPEHSFPLFHVRFSPLLLTS